MLRKQALADGSSPHDQHPGVTIDLTDEAERWRYRCPNGHAGTAWSPTNNHVYCHSCARHARHDPAVDPEHYELLDTKTGDRVPFSAITFTQK